MAVCRRRARAAAQNTPAGPAPITRTSTSDLGAIVRRVEVTSCNVSQSYIMIYLIFR